MKSTAKLLAMGLVGGATVAISGCGSSAPSEPGAAVLARSALKVVAKARSVHVEGTEPDNGLPVDLSIDRAGDLSGTIRLDGANTDIIRVGGKVYLKLTAGILRQYHAPAGACADACGRWIRLSPTEASLLAGPYTMSSFYGDVDVASLSQVTDAGSATLNHQPVWVVRESDGSLVYLSEKPKHYPLEIKSPAGSRGTLVYSRWNSVPTPTAPPAGQIVRLRGLR
jgi:hypothetical protein